MKDKWSTKWAYDVRIVHSWVISHWPIYPFRIPSNNKQVCFLIESNIPNLKIGIR